MNEPIKVLLRLVVPPRLRPRLRALYYGGSRYTCPICGNHLRRFLPAGLDFPVLKEKEVVGGGYYPNILCPVCGSFDRMRLLYLYLLHKTDLFQKRYKILHVAPERIVAERLRLVSGADYMTGDLHGDNVTGDVDITDIRFPDNTFDVIICNHVLEHVIDDKRAMREIYRTLKPGGWAILQVPISLTLETTYEDFSIVTEAGRERAFGQSDHVRLYGRDY